MPTESPTKPPSAAPDKPAANKFDPYRPEMPKIPGVPLGSRSSSRHSVGLDTQRLMLILGIVAAVLIIGCGAFWWNKNKARANTDLTPQSPVVAESATPVTPSQAGPVPTEEDKNVVGTVDELSKPWSSKKFTYVKPFVGDKINAILIRLPGGELWAFVLQEPYGRCELEFVTDLNKLASQYGYRATHPMVGNPCNSTVYDPLKVGPLGGDTWARGEIVQGEGLRPPISISVKVSGRSIIADRME